MKQQAPKELFALQLLTYNLDISSTTKDILMIDQWPLNM
jgi:hypothetical protein